MSKRVYFMSVKFTLKYFAILFLVLLFVPFILAGSPDTQPKKTDDWTTWGRTLNRTQFTNAVTPANVSNATYTPIILAGWSLGSSRIGGPVLANGWLYYHLSLTTLYQVNISNFSETRTWTSPYNMWSSVSVSTDLDSVFLVTITGLQIFRVNATNISKGVIDTVNITDAGGDVNGLDVYSGVLYFYNYAGELYGLNATNLSQKRYNATSLMTSKNGRLTFSDDRIFATGGDAVAQYNFVSYNLSLLDPFKYKGGSNPACAMYTGNNNLYWVSSNTMLQHGNTSLSIYENITSANAAIGWATTQHLGQVLAYNNGVVYSGTGYSDQNVTAFNSSNISQTLYKYSYGSGDVPTRQILVTPDYLYAVSNQRTSPYSLVVIQLRTSDLSFVGSRATGNCNAGDSCNTFLSAGYGYLFVTNASGLYALGNYAPTDDTPVTDTCTPPAVNNNWVVSFSDNCVLSSNTNLGTGKLIVNGTAGTFTLNANLSMNGRMMSCLSGSCKFAQTTSGRLIFA